MFDVIVTPVPAVSAFCFALKVVQSVLLKYPFTLEVAAGIEIVFVVLESGDENVNGASKSVPATAALTTPDPLAFINPLTVPAPPILLPITEPLHVPEVIVPTVVKLELVILEFKVVPDNVPASATTVIFALPSNAVPLIFLAVANFEAVLAFPVKGPVKPVALIVPLVTTLVTLAFPN